jgi:hypothetical protein
MIGGSIFRIAESSSPQNPDKKFFRRRKGGRKLPVAGAGRCLKAAALAAG